MSRSERQMMHRTTSRAQRRSRGFALIVVVWVLALILLLGTAVTVGVRYRTRVDTSLIDVRRAELAAESAINFAILLQRSEDLDEDPSFPLVCHMPGGEQVEITVTAEAGKVDLNAASPQTLIRLFGALTANRAEGEKIAAAILSFRSAASAPNQAQPTAFHSVLQLESVPAISPELFRAALPLVTVRSGKIEPDPVLAPEAVRQALGLQNQPANGATGGADAGDITIRADVRVGRHARFIREALVSLRPENGRLFTVREWRHADADGRPVDTGTDVNPCFKVPPSDR